MNLRINNVPDIRIRLSDGYKNKLTSVFGGVKIYEISGYYVFVAEKRILSKKGKKKTANSLSRKLQRKQQRKKMNR